MMALCIVDNLIQEQRSIVHFLSILAHLVNYSIGLFFFLLKVILKKLLDCMTNNENQGVKDFTLVTRWIRFQPMRG